MTQLWRPPVTHVALVLLLLTAMPGLLLMAATPALAANSTDVEQADGREPGSMPVAIPGVLPIEDILARENGSDHDDGENLAQPQDNVILDDLIVTFSACVGNDCVNGEAFGFDTLRLKENNLRIKFDDTSASASFPANDWQLTANDSSNGGANHFSIDDVTGGRTPFRVFAGAPTNSLWVDSAGDVGFGTDNPAVGLHQADGNTPTLRLEQNGTSGFTPQTWDVAGNEANFFIRDATNGSQLPFKIKPGAPTNSLFVASSGNVGIGEDNPTEKLHVDGAILATSFIQADENIAIGTDSPISTLEIHGEEASVFIENSTTDVVTWVLTPQGNMVIAGNLFESSSRELKENFVPLDPDRVLEQVAQLEVGTWNYIADDPAVSHVGPVAEDWAEIFQLNPDDAHISPSDMSGVALGAIQALHREVQAKDAQIAALEARLAAIERTLQSSGGR